MSNGTSHFGLLVGLALVGVGLSIAGCASSRAPQGWLPTAEDARHTPFGSWISVSAMKSDGGRLTAGGELISANEDSVLVLETSGLTVIRTEAIESVRIERYRARTGTVAAWAALETLATASHGVFLLISAPIWILSGTAAAVNESKSPLITLDGSQIARMAPYARFPSGAPPEVDRKALVAMPRAFP